MSAPDRGVTASAVLETPRLILRMFRADDFEPYAAICADPDVMRYLGDGRALTRPEAWRQMAMIVGHWQLRGYGLWAVEERSTGALVGRIGLFNPEGWPGLEVGWVLGKTCWGRGYATEGARRVLDHAFTDMGLDRLISLIYPDNTASIRVAERIGERLEGHTYLFGHEVLIYRIDRSPVVLPERA
jgi:RimJ/RimL family protein N-acetyltransferase